MSYAIDPGVDACESPRFLFSEKQDEISPQTEPEERLPADLLWVESPGYAGLSPLGVAQWLRDNGRGAWPTTFAGLRHIGVGQDLVDWLELVVGAVYGEEEVTAGFIVAVLENILARAGTSSISLPRAMLALPGEQSAHQLGGATGSRPFEETPVSAHIRRDLLTSDIGQWNFEAFKAVTALQDC